MSRSKGKSKQKKGAKKQQVKQVPAFVRQQVKLTDNLPPIPIRHRIQQIRRIMQSNSAMIQKYVPQQKMTKYQKNFKLFDRNNDNLLIYDELKQFLISIGQMINQSILKQFYKQLMIKSQSADGPVQGIQFQREILQIIIEKMRQEDPQQQLIQAFNIVMDGRVNQDAIESDDFKQFLMTMGYRWPQDMSDEFIKAFQSKADKKLTPNDVIKKLMKR